uniref:Hadrian n=1 Tax=Schmidtea mediterranea TaxID=79327 RepID=I1ZI61_SCHMD|nr:hadrian [Schmidtea mediterranea]
MIKFTILLLIVAFVLLAHGEKTSKELTELGKKILPNKIVIKHVFNSHVSVSLDGLHNLNVTLRVSPRNKNIKALLVRFPKLVFTYDQVVCKIVHTIKHLIIRVEIYGKVVRGVQASVRSAKITTNDCYLKTVEQRFNELLEKPESKQFMANAMMNLISAKVNIGKVVRDNL